MRLLEYLTNKIFWSHEDHPKISVQLNPLYGEFYSIVMYCFCSPKTEHEYNGYALSFFIKEYNRLYGDQNLDKSVSKETTCPLHEDCELD